MQISNVVSGVTDAASATKRAVDASAATATQAVGTGSTQTDGSISALRDVLTKYDITDISPNEYSSMIQDLYQKGAISKTDFQNLAAVRVDLETAGVDSDQSTNILDFYRQQVAKAQRDAGNTSGAVASQNMAPMLQRLSWLEKFAAGHAQPDTIGLNALV